MMVLSLGALRLSCNSSSILLTIPHNLTISSLSSKSYKTHSPTLLLNVNSNSLVSQVRKEGGPFLDQQGARFSVFATKKRNKSTSTLLDMSGYDDDDIGDEEDDDEMFVPFANMKKWLQDKPSGFGEGKVYDTSIEDKLLEEMEQSRNAQLANINNLKNNPPNVNSKKEKQVRAPEVISSGVQVRIGNLPKKKNIHRDLKVAFKEFPGIINISPAVSGNKKTRDPVCKGFAFIDFDTEEAAIRFVKIYSRQSLLFGKIEKQITCEITNPRHSSYAHFEQSIEENYMPTSEQTYPSIKEDLDSDSDIITVNSWEDPSGEYNDLEDQIISADWEETGENVEFANMCEPSEDESMRPGSTTNLLSSKRQKKAQKVHKKQSVKRNSAKPPKLNVPGSAKRLKVREKAVLTGVFSKYGGNPSLTSQEER
ncbi:PREDICTED: uncharacterized protein LOC104595608 [Nelumbo nucifera]|uniref:Uncharacterized protein LOC104595608 n=1 Tax=Nelumbo nucifera TaxID=4432 RepID=A0A1U8A0W8_NELNU|nr:PREDICTED: uncharacterized protein LOC104595608 [Nelumbo nucifera]